MKDPEVRILLVDDDRASNFLNTRLIESVAGDLAIVSVLSAAEALKYFEGRQRFTKHDDRVVVMLDINMPSMDGFEFLESLKTENFDYTGITFFILSSSANIRDIKKAKSYKVDGYITKPLSREKVQSILNDLDDYHNDT